MKKAVPIKKLDRWVLTQQHQASFRLFVFSNDFIWMLAEVFGSWHNNLTDHTIEARSVANEPNLVNSMPSEIDEWKGASPIRNLTDVF